MNKLINKFSRVFLGVSLMLAGMVAVSGKKASKVFAGQRTYTCGFETTEGFEAGSSYQSDDEQEFGPSGKKWGTIYGCVSTSSAIAGSNSVALRLYSGGTLGSLVSKFSLSGVTSVSYKAKAGTAKGAAIKLDTFYSTNGTSWTKVDSAKTISSSATQYSFNVPGGETTNYYIKFAIASTSTRPSSGNAQLTIDDLSITYISNVPRGEISVNNLATPVLGIGSSANLSYTWVPASGSSATISSYSYTSNAPTILSVNGNQITGLKAGVADVTLNATDSLGESYMVASQKIFVTNSCDFGIGDNVVLYSNDALKELSGINTEGTNYGTGADYSTTPAGTFALSVEEGSETDSFAFKNGENYLSWASGNTLTSSANKNKNSSWYVVVQDGYLQICNAATPTREIWWNSGTPRFACYEGKTPTTSGYNSVSLLVIESVPIRGSLSISAPTDKVMRGDASGDLTYAWTPNEQASEVEIASHSWTSSDPTVISISGDTYTAEGPGKATLTLNATDSLGENYTVIGSEIEVVSVVSGAYVKRSYVTYGDIVTFVCESDLVQISGVSSNVGQYVFYATSPAATYTFELEEGSVDGSFAFKTSNDQYLSWTGHGGSTSANIGLVDDVDQYSSWTVSFNEGNAVVSNVGLDGEAHRYIAWNHGSPRFAAYKSGQTPIQLYGPALSYDAAAFAKDLLDETSAQCSTYVDDLSDYAAFKSYFEGVWETLAGENYFAELGSADITALATAHANKDSSDVIEQAMARYDLLTVKYNLDNFITGRTPTVGQTAGLNYRTSASNNSMMIVIIVVSLVSVTSLGVLFVIKRRYSSK